MINHEFAQP